jgi:PAS domain S-box-containing protein
MLHPSSIYRAVSAIVALAVSAVVLITIRHARKTHGSLRAAFQNIVRAMRSVLRDDGELRFRTLDEALPQIVWTAIPGGGVDYCNRRWYEPTGFTEAQTLGWGWANALHPDDRLVALGNWEKCRFSGESFEMEYRLLNAAGGFRRHLGRATPMRDSDGTIVKWFGACADR